MFETWLQVDPACLRNFNIDSPKCKPTANLQRSAASTTLTSTDWKFSSGWMWPLLAGRRARTTLGGGTASYAAPTTCSHITLTYSAMLAVPVVPAPPFHPDSTDLATLPAQPAPPAFSASPAPPATPST